MALQDLAWRQGDNPWITAFLLQTLQAKGITLALADALFHRLIDLKVFIPWTHMVPAGRSYERGCPLPIFRDRPETTHCLVTTRERWYGYLAAKKAEADAQRANHNFTPRPPASLAVVGDGQAAKDDSPPPSAGSGTNSSPTAPCRPDAAFIPSELQEDILQALDGKALTLDALAVKLHVDRGTVYRDGVKELKARALIDNHRRVGGYYRPDALPPKYADLLGKKHS